ncbi:MAG: leucine--tRNA ligase [Chlamydiae bacterium RIFCSPHIGHO2_12_FULL_44_59]|nr:MAG: leucine--tRNA ligase [Chlamydiae bacterium RIFCSPHIGHO2_01_FULL_44_39]OGN59898.1 MAG: leucine--tRNA ligase [Chlamydiae bacterium RIFCSPHIGHO2_12_FULL_44_59]OGN66105.1 MAG: leucine--tRNA ligase [Chlamydiae bacterium RIFCSPLOWO2_01_FULL_44_52]OGN68640.1 MAG: leucine--tRNA ligase [Chlamydiae bacterium RIFCSPLOWO2_02_FULL_45_22]OGN69753.1 MAG: leucine--tRNA ligase [Chlamydiae bacterium RIFCSPLOWO2_12_FULL_45_20]
MKKKYDPKVIERKWQKIWKERKTFRSEVDSQKQKYYILDMFPYPSGAGLHVGHVTGYTGTDILARYKRQKGMNVLHPMGWDSFGLPAEQFAIRTGTHPALTTKTNIETYRRQLESLGFSYDWDREITTSAPSYYKWTQWIFTKLFEKGLAYEAEINVNFCPVLGTVLANEEIENGKSKEGGYPVERRPLKQWVLRITAYADRLLGDLDLLDWPEHLKKLQTNWIGRSEGALITFMETVTSEPVTVFTTRADTLFGVSYVVMAPEHPLVSQVVTPFQKKAVESYQQLTASKNDLDRTDLAKGKTGVWTGAYVNHPVTHQKIPLWIADYVLMGYGTGAVMAVPAHDERDFEFAETFNLPILPVIDPGDCEEREAVVQGKRCWSGDGTLRESSFLSGLLTGQAIEKMIQWLEQHSKGKRTVSYKLRDWLFSRQRYWGEPIPILHFPDGTMRSLELDELPLVPPELSDYKPSGSGKSPLAKVREWVEITDLKTGRKALRETNTMPQWAGSCWYYLRFCDPNNGKEAWDPTVEKYWMPVDLYVGGVEHAVLHLLYARFWHKVLYDCGLVSTQEPFLKLRNQGLVTAPSYKRSQGGYVLPEDVEGKGGAFYYEGEELIAQVEKMSKSKLNGVTPDEIIEEYGADSLRLYEMFMGPFDKEKLWNTDAVSGCRRFLNRFYDMVTSEKLTDEEHPEALRLTYRLLEAVAKDIELMQFNTAIAKMMEFINAFIPLEAYPKRCLKWAVQALYPFAPHIGEELWEYLGEKESITYAPFPLIDRSCLEETSATYVVQINGKLRGRLVLPKDQSEEELMKIIQKQSEIAQYIKGEVVKTVFVPNKLLNIVVK